MRANFFLILCVCGLLFPSLAFAQRVVTGKVMDNDGTPLPGVSIASDKNNQTTSNEKGDFSLAVDPQSTTLTLSDGQYTSQSVVLTASTNDVGTIYLEKKNSELQEVIVVGYGTQRKELVSGAFSNISASDIVKNNPIRIDQALQGKTAGVQVTSSSGSPGSNFNIRIRGVTTNGDNSPLVLMNGIPVSSADLSILDPNDIEKIDRLKTRTKI